MSSNLFWRPLPTVMSEMHIGKQMKFLLINKLGTDADLYSWRDFSEEEWGAYLNGVYDGTTNEELIEEIDKIRSAWENNNGIIQLKLIN